LIGGTKELLKMSNLLKKVTFLGIGVTLVVWSIGLAAFVPVASATTIVDGDLVKTPDSPAVYLIDGSTKRVFPHANVYHSWGYPSDYSTVKTVTADELAEYEDGSAVPFRDGSLFRGVTSSVHGKSASCVFVVEDGKLRPILSEDVYTNLYNGDWSLITWVPDSLLSKFAYPLGDTVTSADVHTNGTLIRYEGSPAIYLIEDGKKRAFSSWDALVANRYYVDGRYTVPLITVADTETYEDGDPITGAELALLTPAEWSAEEEVGALAISLSDSTPAAGYVAKKAQNALFAKFNFKATGGKVTVSKIVLKRKGLGYDADFDAVRLYDGATQLGTDQSINTTTHEVTFSGLNWEIPSGQTKVLSVKANIATSPSGTNDYFELTEVTADGEVSGLPVAGNAMQFANLSVGQLDVDAVSSGSSVDVISGATDQELGCWNFTTDSTEGFYVESIKLTNIGTAASTDALNFVLKVGSTVIPGSGVDEMASNGTVTFDLTDSPYYIAKSKTKKICVYGDIKAGITVSKTLRFQIAEAKDVVARGESSGGEVLITYSSGTAFTSQSAKTVNITQGSATLSQDAAYAPTSGTVLVKGVPSNKLAAYKLTAGPTEGVRLTKLVLTLDGTGVTNTDFANWKLYKIEDGEEVDTGVTGSVSGMTITFENTTDGIVDVEKSLSKTLIVRADVSTSFAGTETNIKVYIGANGTTNTLARIKGLESQEYISNGVTLSGVATGDAQTFTGAAKGNLAVSKAADSPAADSVAKGATNFHFTTIDLYATGEDIEVTDLVLTGYETAGTTDAVETGDLSNVYITDEDGNQLGSTVTNPSSGEFSFSFSYVVPKDTHKKILVYGDVPSGTTSSYLHIDMDTANTDITSVGVYSSETIAETGTCTGSTMTVASPTITAAMASTPVASSYVVNASGVTIGTLLLTAGTAEDVKVTTIKISADDANSLDSTSAANSSFSNIRLIDAIDGTTQYGTTKNLTDGTPDYVSFTGISNLTIPKGSTKRIHIVVDVDGTSGTFYFGVADASTEITGVGLSSNTSATVTPSSAIYSAGATLTSSGLLKVSKAADMPVAAQLVSGTDGVEVAKYKFEALYEDIDVTKLPLYFTGTLADVANVKLYVDGELLGDANGYVFSSNLKNVYFDSGTFIVHKGTPVYLTIKADINDKDQVTTSVSSSYFGLADASGDNSDWGSQGKYSITAKGVSSGSTIDNINTTGASGGYVYGSNAFTFHKGILTISLNSASPSGSSTAGANKPLIYLDLAATGDDITINGIEFCYSGVAGNATGGSLVLKSSDGSTTYGTITATEFDNYWDDRGGDGNDEDASIPLKTGVDSNEQCFSWGRTGQVTIYDQSTHAEDSTGKAMDAFTNTISITAGDTITIKLYGDTTGFTTNDSLQISVMPNSATAYKVFTSGLEYEDSSGTDVDLTTTKNLPVDGNTLTY